MEGRRNAASAVVAIQEWTGFTGSRLHRSHVVRSVFKLYCLIAILVEGYDERIIEQRTGRLVPAQMALVLHSPRSTSSNLIDVRESKRHLGRSSFDAAAGAAAQPGHRHPQGTPCGVAGFVAPAICLAEFPRSDQRR